MSLKTQLCCVIITCCLIKFNCAVIRPSKDLNITEGEGFLAYLEVSEQFGDIQKCSYQFNDEDQVPIDLKNNKLTTTARGEQILPFSENICGVRVNKVSTATAGNWTLTAKSATGLTDTGMLTITTNDAKRSFETILQKPNGEGYLSCTKSAYSAYCQIRNLGNGKTWDSCGVTTALSPDMSFECLTFNAGRLEQTREVIKIKNLPSNSVTKASLEDTSDHIILRCQGQESFGDCRVQKPLGSGSLLLKSGLYDGHFSSFITDTTKSLCTLDIAKPLAEHEKGVWRIIGSKTLSGCLYYVGDSEQNIIKNELVSLNKLQEMEVYDTSETIAEMSITVPFPITACYLRSPSNNLYYPDAYQIERTSQYGKCIIKKLPVESGFWVFGANGGEYEAKQFIDVKVKSKLGETLTKSVSASIGGTVELMCKSAFGEPIDKCAFINPRNEVIFAAANDYEKKTGRITYFANGLASGECGIMIQNLENEDFGEWNCQFIVLSGNRQTSLFKMSIREGQYVRSFVLGQASTIGLSVGISSLIAVIGSLLILSVYFKRRTVRARQSIASNEPMAMGAMGPGNAESVL